jgi:hypothetical protein
MKSMKKIVLFLLAASFFAASCQKTVKVPVSYTVESIQNTVPTDIYIPDLGTTTLPLLVKFLGGFSEDTVMLTLKGLPADVRLDEDTITGVPTFRADFKMSTNKARLGTYPVTLTAVAPGSDPKNYRFNVIVTPADCASALWGNLSGSNDCSDRNFTYTATGTSSGSVNVLNLVNFGGYGSNTSTLIVLNCNNDSLTIPAQNIGNGTNLQGYGTFTPTGMTVYYSATSTPGGFPESCTATFTK